MQALTNATTRIHAIYVSALGVHYKIGDGSPEGRPYGGEVLHFMFGDVPPLSEAVTGAIDVRGAPLCVTIIYYCIKSYCMIGYTIL